MDLVARRPGMWPYAEFERLQKEINDLFDLGNDSDTAGLFDRTVSPAVDVVEMDDQYVVYCDVPGVEQKGIDVSLTNNVLTIRGEKRDERGTEESKKSFRKETWSGLFQRTITFPDNVDSEKTTAAVKNGVLTVTLQKREEAKPKKIAVDVS